MISRDSPGRGSRAEAEGGVCVLVSNQKSTASQNRQPEWKTAAIRHINQMQRH